MLLASKLRKEKGGNRENLRSKIDCTEDREPESQLRRGLIRAIAYSRFHSSILEYSEENDAKVRKIAPKIESFFLYFSFVESPF